MRRGTAAVAGLVVLTAVIGALCAALAAGLALLGVGWRYLAVRTT